MRRPLLKVEEPGAFHVPAVTHNVINDSFQQSQLLPAGVAVDCIGVGGCCRDNFYHPVRAKKGN